MADRITSVPAKSSLSAFRWAAKNPTPDPVISFSGQTILITGPNAGLGFEAATKFVALGASTIIFGVRSLERGEKAKSDIEKRTGCHPNMIKLFELDMCSYSSIENFIVEINANFPVVHAAVLNAGVMVPSYSISPEGWEISLQVHVISTAYLAVLLLPILRHTGVSIGKPAHLEFVTSVVHGDVNADSVKGSDGILKQANDPKCFNSMTQYSITKLLEVWAMRSIAAKVSSSEVIIMASCPSCCKSTLNRDFNPFLQLLDNALREIVGRTAEQGSRVLVSAITANAEAHGGFWSHDQVSV